MKPRVFIGSSSEAAEYVAPILQAELARVATVQMWNQDFFPPGTYVLDVLAEKAQSFDFAILVFAADDVVETRGNRYLSVRDNTVLEAGYFLAELGRLRTFIVVPSVDGLKLPSDLNGLTWVPYPQHLDLDLIRAELGPSCLTLRNRIQQLGRRSTPDSRLSDGMVAVLGIIDARGPVTSSVVRKAIARLNGEATDTHPAWDKATQYLMGSLSQLGLVDFDRISGDLLFKLTRRGRARTKDLEFTMALQRVLASERGARIQDFFHD